MVYVIPIISYASIFWLLIKTEYKEIERTEKKATAWILSSCEVNYEKRLSEIKLLPLSYCFELSELLTLISFLQGNYIELQIKLNENAMNTRQMSSKQSTNPAHQ